MPLPIPIAIPEQNLLPSRHRPHRDHDNHRHAIDQRILADGIGLRSVFLTRAIDMVEHSDPLACVEIHFTDRSRCLIHEQKIDAAIFPPHVAVHMRVRFVSSGRRWIQLHRPVGHRKHPARWSGVIVTVVVVSPVELFGNCCVEIKTAGGVLCRIYGQHFAGQGTQHSPPLWNVAHGHHTERRPRKAKLCVHLGDRPRVQLHQTHMRPQELVAHRRVTHSQRELRGDAALRNLRAAKLNVIFSGCARKLGMHRTQTVGEAFVDDMAISEDSAARLG